MGMLASVQPTSPITPDLARLEVVPEPLEVVAPAAEVLIEGDQPTRPLRVLGEGPAVGVHRLRQPLVGEVFDQSARGTHRPLALGSQIAQRGAARGPGSEGVESF